MTTLQRGSAKIYQFPARGRFALGDRQQDSSVVNLATARPANATHGGAWYHEDAITQSGEADDH